MCSTHDGGAMVRTMGVVVHGGGITNGDATAAEIAVHELGDVGDPTTQRGQVGRGRAHGVGELEHALFLGYVLKTYGGGTLGEEAANLDKLVKRGCEVRVVVNCASANRSRRASELYRSTPW